MYHVLIHSYGGMLTAWIRFKYPNLVDGGLAASAPIFYTEGLVSRTAFFGKVTEVISLLHCHVHVCVFKMCVHVNSGLC